MGATKIDPAEVVAVVIAVCLVVTALTKATGFFVLAFWVLAAMMVVLVIAHRAGHKVSG